MMYLWPQTNSMRHMSDAFGVMTRASDNCVPNGIKEGRVWAMDNEAFTRGFDFERWLAHWHRLAYYSKRCVFVVVPDVVGDWYATRQLWDEWHGRIRAEMDYYDNLRHVVKPWLCLAYVAQDGQESHPLPGWPEAQWVFIGGSTEWKMSEAADSVIRRAQAEKQWVHIGRVNSIKRVAHFQYMDVDCADGTTACHEPTAAKRRLTYAAHRISFFS